MGKYTEQQLRHLRTSQRPRNFDDEQWAPFRDLPQFTGKRGVEEDQDMYWYDGNDNNKFDFGEFFDFDDTVETEGENLYRGYETTQANNRAYDEGRFGRDFLGRIRKGGGTDREMRANELQQYLNNEPVDPSGIGMFAGSKPTDNRFGQAAKMLGSAVLAPSVGAVSNAFDALPLPAYNPVHGFHEGTDWDDRTTPFSNAAADIALSAPVLGPAAKTIQGGVNAARVPLKAMQGPVRSVRNFKPGAGRWPPLTPEPLKEAARSAKGLTQDFATGATTTIRELPSAARDLSVKALKSANPFSSVNKTVGFFGGGAAGSRGLDYLDENTDFDLDEWTPEFEDETPIDRALELEELNDVYNLDDNNTLSPLSNDQFEILKGVSNPAGAKGGSGDTGHLGTSGSMSPSISPELEKSIKDSLEFNNARSLDGIDLLKDTAPAPGSPMHGDSPAFSGGTRVVPSPNRPPQNDIVPPQNLNDLRKQIPGLDRDQNPATDPAPDTPQWPHKGWKGGGVDPKSSSQWSDAPPLQAQPAALPTEQEQWELETRKADPRYKQAMGDSEDYELLRSIDHPAARRPIARPTHLDKPDRTFHYKDGVKQVIPGKKFMGGRWDPWTSIRNAAAEERRNRDLGAKAYRSREINRDSGFKDPYGPRDTMEALLEHGQEGPRGARGEAGPVGLDDAVNEAEQAQRQAYFKTHNLDEPTDPEEMTRFSKWYNTHGKQNDQNNRWSDSEPYPKFDPYLA